MPNKILTILGKEGEALLTHKCTTIPKENLHLLFNHGRLAGTGYLSILPVDQGIEHSGGPSGKNDLTSASFEIN